MKTERQVYMVCPKCYKMIIGTQSFEANDNMMDPMISLKGRCTYCGTDMINVDFLSIPILMALWTHGFETVACCDRHHDGDVFDKEMSGDDPFVTVAKLTEAEIGALDVVIAEFNRMVGDNYEASYSTFDDIQADDVLISVKANYEKVTNADRVRANVFLNYVISRWIKYMEANGVAKRKKIRKFEEPFACHRSMPPMADMTDWRKLQEDFNVEVETD